MKRTCSIKMALLLVMLFNNSFAQPVRRWASSCVLSKDRITRIEGEVKLFNPPILLIKSNNKTLTLRLGPYWFWERYGVKLFTGDKIVAKGIDCGSFFVPYQIETKHKIIILRDKNGFPAWRRIRWRKLN